MTSPAEPAADVTKTTVRDVMSQPPHVFDEDERLVDALRELERLPVYTAPVVAGDGTPMGVLTQSDALAAREQGSIGSLTVCDVCRRDIFVGADDSLELALRAFRQAQVGRIPVIAGGSLVGEVCRGDIRQHYEKEKAGERLDERTKVRWKLSRPTPAGCTWGEEVSGNAFIEKADSYGAFGPEKAVLEIGPGYGRLLRACLERGVAFRRYVAVDISQANVAHLRREFRRADVGIVNADIETVSLDAQFDSVLSSLTLKHLYPSFEKAFRNVARHLRTGAVVIFDLIEGERWQVASDVDFHRAYSRSEVEAILAAVPLELVAYDEVTHAPGRARLLVVARKT